VNNKTNSNAAIVYSTEHGRMCPTCGQPQTHCLCGKKATVSKGDGVIRVSWETKGRKGKGVTIIAGVPVTPEALRDLAKQLKQHCGSGGTVKDNTIEMQGDHRNFVVETLKNQGYQVKRVGG